MGFIRSGFTGGFLGIVLSIADIFINSRILEKLSNIGLYLAKYFGKACINTEEVTCTLTEKFTTILATIVGNTIAYFIIFALISLGFSVIKMWFKSKPKEEQAKQVSQAQQQTQQQAPQVKEVQEAKPEEQEEQEIKEEPEVKEEQRQEKEEEQEEQPPAKAGEQKEQPKPAIIKEVKSQKAKPRKKAKIKKVRKK